MRNILFLCCVLIGLSGCATIDSVYSGQEMTTDEKALGRRMTADEREIDIKIRQEKSEQRLKDVYNGYKLISESSDLYLEKVDGSEKVRITYTPDIKETRGFIIKDKSCVAYRTTDSTFLEEKHYLQPIGKDSSFSEKLSDDQWDNLLTERFPDLAQDNY